MSDARNQRRAPLVLAPPTYRWVDRVTKLAGVAFVAVGLEVGGYTLAGFALGACGAMLAVSTVFVERATDSGRDSTDE